MSSFFLPSRPLSVIDYDRYTSDNGVESGAHLGPANLTAVFQRENSFLRLERADESAGVHAEDLLGH
jgi:hypothetical protein